MRKLELMRARSLSLTPVELGFGGCVLLLISHSSMMTVKDARVDIEGRDNDPPSQFERHTLDPTAGHLSTPSSSASGPQPSV
jgi:hypothetical protein